MNGLWSMANNRCQVVFPNPRLFEAAAEYESNNYLRMAIATIFCVGQSKLKSNLLRGIALFLAGLCSLVAYSQNAIVGTGFTPGFGGACGTNTNFKYFSASGFGTSYTSGTLTPNGTGNQYWRIGVDFGGTVKQLHLNASGTDVAVVPNTTYTLNSTCVTAGAMYRNVSSITNSYIFKTQDAGNNPSGNFVFFELSANPITVSTVTQSPLAANVFPGQAVTVTANLSSALPSGQSVYLRYSNNNFSTSTVLTLSGSGTTYTATIPATFNTPSANVAYYVFTSGTAGVLPDGSNADFYTINLNNNSGANYSYTVKSGWVTAANGTWNAAATWTANAVPPTTLSMGAVSVGHSVSFNQDAVASSLAISGALTASANTLTINNNSSAVTFANTGTYTASGTHAVSFSGTGTHSISGTVGFNNVNTSTGVNFGSSSTVNGTFTINNGGFVQTNAPTYAVNSTLAYNSGNNYGASAEWTSGQSVGQGVPYHVSIGNTVANSGLNFGSSAAFRQARGAISIGSATAFLTLSTAAGGDLYAGGNLSNSGTFTHNARGVLFNGTAQTVQGFGTGGNSPTNCFANISIANGTNVSLNSSTVVNTAINFISGKITLGVNDLTLNTPNAFAGASSSNYVVAASTGKLLQSVSSSAVAFPVGNSAYDPITLINTGVADVYGIALADGSVPNTQNQNKFVKRTWYVTEAVSGGGNLSASMQYNGSEEGAAYVHNSPYIGLYDFSSGNWMLTTANLAGTDPYTVAGIGGFNVSLPTSGNNSYFAIGNKDAYNNNNDPWIFYINPSSTYAGSASFTLTVTGDNFTNASTVTWNGSNRTTTYVSATQLTATILASDVASVGTAIVGVFTSGKPVATNPQTFTIVSSCTPTAPSNPVVSNVTNAGATVSWTAGSTTDYEYAVITSPTPPASGTFISATTDFVSGLSSSTTYWLHVRTRCGYGFSAWVTSDPFTTEAAPTGLVTWVPTGLSNYGPSPWTYTTADSRLNLAIIAMTRGAGVTTTNTAASNAWGGNSWTGTATEDATFTVEAITGYKVSLSSLNLSYRRSATGPTTGTLYYTINNGTYINIGSFTFSSTAISGATHAPISLSGVAALQNVPNGSVIKFRILPSGGTAGGTWYLYNEGLALNGTIAPAVTAPTATAATLINPTCFVANWNAVPSATNYYLDVYYTGFSIDPAFTIVAGWDFATALTANSGIPANIGKTITAVGTNPPTLASDQTARADSWDNGNGTKYWEVNFSTTNYYNIKVSSKQRSSATGPKDFKLQYKIGAGGTYTDVTSGTVTVANDYVTGKLANVALPSACDNQTSVYLRWIMTSNTSVGGGTVGSTGASNIDDISITGNAGLNTTYVSGYQNKSVGNVVSTQVTGLTAGITYYYVVRAVVGGVTSANSNQITLATSDYTTADYRSKQSGAWSAASTWEYDPGCSGTWTAATAAPGTGNNVFIQNSNTVTLDVNPVIGTGKTLTVNSGAVLATKGFTVSGAGAFNLLAGGTLSIGSSNGIAAAAATGNIQVTGTRTYNTSANYIYAGTANQVTGDGLPASIYTLSIANTGGSGNNTVSMTRAGTTALSSTFNPSLVLTSGLLALGSGNTLTIASGAGISATAGNFSSPNAGTVNFLGLGTVAGTVDFYPTVVIKGGIDFGTASTIRNTLQIDAGGYVNPSAPTYATGSYLIYNNGPGNYQRNAEWGTGSSGPGVPYHVTVQNNTILLFDYNNASAADRYLLGDLTLGNATGFGWLDMGAMTKKIVVSGNLIIGGTVGTSNLKLSSQIGGDVQVNGNWTRNPNGTFTPNNRTVYFAGSTATTIAAPTQETFDYLVAAKTGLPGTITLSNDIQVNKDLTLSSIITTGAKKVIITSTGNVLGAGSGTGWIAGNIQKYFPTGAVSKTFEIGGTTGYRPMTVSFSNVSTAGSLIGFVTQADGEHPQVAGSGINSAKDLNRYFTLTPVGLAMTGTYDVTFNYIAADVDGGANPSSFVVRRYNGSVWNSFGSEVNSPLSTKVTVGQLSPQNEFVIGECLTPNVSNFVLSATTVCQGNASVVSISSTSMAAGTYDVTYQLSGANNASNQTATVVLSGTGTVNGTFNTTILPNNGNTTLTITAISLSGTLQCSPSLGAGFTASITVNQASVAATGITVSSAVICSGGNTTLTVSGGLLGTGANWKWYTGSCGGTLAGTGPSITVSPSATTTYFVRAEGTCNNTSCQQTTITVGSVNTWTGTTNTDWNIATNWGCGFVPPAGYDVLIPNVTNQPVLTADATVGNLAINAGAALSLNNKILTLNGNVSGTGTLTGSKTSSLIINGGTSTLLFMQTIDTVSNALANLTVNSGNITLGNKLAIYTLLNLAGGSLNLAGKPVVLKSNSGGTAYVAEIKGTLSGETAVTVERYIPQLNSRKWRLVTAPVSGPSLNASWQEGMTYNGVGHKLTGSSTPATPTPGFGTIITGQQQGTAINANGSGFDFWPEISNSQMSVRKYVGAPNNINAQWAIFGNTTTAGAFNQSQAYLLFVRGDRTVTIQSDGVKATTLRATGTLRKGPQSMTLYGSALQSHTLIGNPYPAPLDFKQVYADNPGVLQNRFWLLNSGLGGAYGAYQLTVGYPDGTYEVLPLDFSQTNIGTSDPAWRVINSGSAFLLEPATAGNSTLSIKESQKVIATPAVSVFRTQRAAAAQQKFYINLSDATGGGKTLLDGAMARWDQSYSKASDETDIKKAINVTENLSLFRTGNDLMIASAEKPSPGDTLQLRLWNTATQRTYLFETKALNLSSTGLIAYLLDNYLKNKTVLPLTGTVTPYSFSITDDPASKDPQRFQIVFEQEVLPLTVGQLKAFESSGGATVEWGVADERGIQAYVVESAVDGINYRSFATVNSRGGAGLQLYSAFDPHPSLVNYYRIRIEGKNGKVAYSDTVKLTLQRPEGWTVTPNPVTANSFSLQLANKPSGDYTLLLYTPTGQLVLDKIFRFAGGTGVEVISLDKRLASGYYRLSIREPSGRTETKGLVIAH